VRIDGKPLQQQFQVDQIECRGDAAQSGAVVQTPAYPSLLTLSVAANERNQTELAVMQSCMAKKGYLLQAGAEG
jgi:hypothetical protein